MAIESEQQLIALLSAVRGLDPEDIDVMVSTASYLPNGLLRGLYIKSMIRKCPRPEVIAFFQRAGANLIGFGGDQRGDRVYPDHYPTSDIAEPCKPRNGYSCWVPASNPWKPTD
jgi:hypothetical protein